MDALKVPKNRDYSLAEAYNKQFDWNAFLDKKDITQQEWSNAILLSSSWVTCACGNQCIIIPRVGAEPVDIELRELGVQFMHSIKNRQLYT